MITLTFSHIEQYDIVAECMKDAATKESVTRNRARQW